MEVTLIVFVVLGIVAGVLHGEKIRPYIQEHDGEAHYGWFAHFYAFEDYSAASRIAQELQESPWFLTAFKWCSILGLGGFAALITMALILEATL